jgi:hypothetical protein
MINRIIRHVGVSASAATAIILMGQASCLGATILNFDEFNARGAGVRGQPVADYFAAAGVMVTGDDLIIHDVRDFTDRGVEFTAPASRPNFLGGTKSPQNNVWTFPTPMTEVSFVRNALITTGPGGTTHPEWQAVARDAVGGVLGTVGESLIATFGNEPLRTFTLNGVLGQPIKTIEWHSDHHNFAGYGAVILDNVVLSPVPEPSAAAIFSVGLIAAIRSWPRGGCRSFITQLQK